MSGLKLLMTTDAVGGVWTYALDLAAGLAAHGVTTTLAVLGPPPSAEQRRQAASIRSLALYQTGLPLDWLATGPQDVCRAADGIASLASRVGADVVHLNTPSLAACVRFDQPVVAVCHSCVRTWWDAVHGGELPSELAWQARLLSGGYAAAGWLIAPTHAFAEATRRAYQLPNAPIVIHNGRKPIARSSAPMADVVFTAGRLWDRGKNVTALERVSKRLAWPVHAAGPTDGPDGSTVALDGIKALGSLEAPALAALLAKRPIFISLARYEPFGLAVLEAAQAGCALVLADTPGFRELWEGAATFVPLDDDMAAIAALEHLIVDRPSRQRAGERSTARATRYNVDAMTQRMLQVYRDAHASSRAAA